MLNIGDRLRTLRMEKNLSQGDIEKRCGLLRCYVSRVENGQTVPAVETLEKFARALEVPIYELFYDGDLPPPPPIPKNRSHVVNSGKNRRDSRFLERFRLPLSMMRPQARALLLEFAKGLVRLHS